MNFALTTTVSRRFCENKLVQKAWGFTGIYKNVPHYQLG